MRTPCSRIVVAAFAATALVGIARAQPEGAPKPLDATPQNEQYVIQPGAESLFADMLGSGQTLPGGCTLSDGKIEGTSVLATYTCDGGHVVLQMLHPEIAQTGGVRTQRFAVTVKSGAPPAGLVDAVADRIRAREAAFEWKRIGAGGEHTMRGAQTTRWVVVVAAAAAVTVVFWALRRLTGRGRGSA